MFKLVRTIRFYSTNQAGANAKAKAAGLMPDAKLLNQKLKQERDLRRERNKLALSSIKDIFAIFSPTAGDDDEFDTANFDPTPLYKNPEMYLKLSLPKQHYILEELEDKFKRKWTGIDKDKKRFIYWLAYGPHGPREGFVTEHRRTVVPEKKESSTLLDRIIAETESQKYKVQVDEYVPPDLPFRTPSVLKSVNPSKDTIISTLPPRDPRLFGPKRVEQYKKDRKMNPYSQFVLGFLMVLTFLNYRKDREVNSSGKVPDYEYLQNDRLLQIDDLSKKLAQAVK
ncbi:hypothetical protein KL942_003240 [Ogataea angusta]|uniref:Genetic interactor of prohibitin 7, mitochondrial n=1 Tax=Pichia angusta TaxID=870730 RepID=A0ABQ7RW49_PICAN|nr:hypothetical protein KL942_003240 [Ogataea angusta]KAG7849262.1 hypothetical protein KL940_002944 [Ogataea angusta]